MVKSNSIYKKLGKLRPKALSKFENHHSKGKETFGRNSDSLVHTLDRQEEDYKRQMKETADTAGECIEKAVVSALRAKLVRHEMLAAQSALVLNQTNKFYHSVMCRIARDVRLGVVAGEDDLFSMLPPELIDHLKESIAGTTTDGLLEPVVDEVERGVK